MEWLTFIFAHICGQGRCFVVDGVALPVCQRCLGLYAGAALAGAYLAATGLWRRGLPGWWAFGPQVVLLILAGLGGCHALDPGPIWRLLCGYWTGAIAMHWLAGAPAELAANREARSQYPVPSTQKPVPSTQKPVPSTQKPVPSTQKPVPSTQKPVPSTQYPEPGRQDLKTSRRVRDFLGTGYWVLGTSPGTPPLPWRRADSIGSAAMLLLPPCALAALLTWQAIAPWLWGLLAALGLTCLAAALVRAMLSAGGWVARAVHRPSGLSG